MFNRFHEKWQYLFLYRSNPFDLTMTAGIYLATVAEIVMAIVMVIAMAIGMDLSPYVYVGLHRMPFVTRCDRGCLMFTGLY
jgi:hypothetical protein